MSPCAWASPSLKTRGAFPTIRRARQVCPDDGCRHASTTPTSSSRPRLRSGPARSQANGAQIALVVTIPVVFHVVYANSTNIPDERLFEQLQIRRRLPPDERRWDNIGLKPPTRKSNSAGHPQRTAPVGRSFACRAVPFRTSDNVKFSVRAVPMPGQPIYMTSGSATSAADCGYARSPVATREDGIVCGYPQDSTAVPVPTSAERPPRSPWLNLRHIWGDGGPGRRLRSGHPESDGAKRALGHIS